MYSTGDRERVTVVHTCAHVTWIHVGKSIAVRGAAEGEAGGEAREALREGPRVCRWGAEAAGARRGQGSHNEAPKLVTVSVSRQTLLIHGYRARGLERRLCRRVSTRVPRKSQRLKNLESGGADHLFSARNECS
jgi:hypothetical protein